MRPAFKHTRASTAAAGVLVLSCMVTAGSGRGEAARREAQTGAFVVEHTLVLPGAPVTIYDAVTADIGEWWDHSFSESPLEFYMEPVPGGGFWEIFDESGDGVRHAVVIFADRGKRLRFEGPLGLSGRAIQMVHTFEFSNVGNDSTRLDLSVHASGEIESGLAETVEKVWWHFLVERLKPYVESGAHLDRPRDRGER